MGQDALRDLLFTERLPVVGLLLVMVILLGLVIKIQDKRIQKLNDDKRVQEADSIKILGELTNVIKRGQDIDIDTKKSVANIKESMQSISQEVSSNTSNVGTLKELIIKKLLDMN